MPKAGGSVSEVHDTYIQALHTFQDQGGKNSAHALSLLLGYLSGVYCIVYVPCCSTGSYDRVSNVYLVHTRGCGRVMCEGEGRGANARSKRQVTYRRHCSKGFCCLYSRIPLVHVFSLTAAMCFSFVSFSPFLWRIMLDVESGAWEYMHIAVIYLSFADGQ